MRGSQPQLQQFKSPKPKAQGQRQAAHQNPVQRYRTKLADSGIPIGMSSDGMQISPMNPWLGLYYVVTGKNARGELINAGQTLSRAAGMRLYTAANGWFLGEEGQLGSIEAGKYADLAVLSGDYFDSRAVSDEDIKRLPSVLTIVGGHIGHPWTDEMIGLAWKHDNVVIDTSAYAPRYYPPALLQYLSSYGRDKVLFGTNFPQLPLERCVAEARALDLPDASREAFLSGNARRVFGL